MTITEEMLDAAESAWIDVWLEPNTDDREAIRSALIAGLSKVPDRNEIIEECAVTASWFIGVAGVVAAIRALKTK